MPYDIVKRSDGWHVINKDSGDDKGVSETRSDAEAHMRALYAHEKKDLHIAEPPEAEQARDEKKEADEKCMAEGYRPYGGATSFAAADAYHEMSEKQEELRDLSWQFEAITANIWASDMDTNEKASAIKSAADDLQSRLASAAAKSKPGFMDRVKSFFQREDNWDNAEKALSLGATLGIFKDTNGAWRYVSVATNQFRDKEGQAFSAESHRDYVDWVDSSKEYPELWLWHTPGTRIGIADCIYFDEDSGFRVSTGTFDKGLDDVAERLSQMPELAMSHGYLFKLGHLDKQGIYHRYRDFEETVLPSADVAASDATAFISLREEPMTVPAVKRDFFEKVLGKERFAKIEASLGERAAAMTDDEFATAFKAVLEETAEEAPKQDPATAAATTEEPKEKEDEAAAPDEKAITAFKAAVTEALTPVTTSLKELTDWKEKVDERLVKLEKDDDEKIAAMFGIRGFEPGSIVAPTDADDNQIDGRAMKALKSALSEKGEEEAKASPVAFAVEMLAESLGAPVSA